MMRLELPEDVMEFLTVVQAEKKVEKSTRFYSLPNTVIFCMRELMKMKQFQPRENEKKSPS